jgi:hypothetical protein
VNNIHSMNYVHYTVAANPVKPNLVAIPWVAPAAALSGGPRLLSGVFGLVAIIRQRENKDHVARRRRRRRFTAASARIVELPGSGTYSSTTPLEV